VPVNVDHSLIDGLTAWYCTTHSIYWQVDGILHE